MYDGYDRLYGVPGEFSVFRCGTCGLAFTEPRLSGEELGRYYPTDYVPHQPLPRPRTLRERLGARLDAARFSTGVRFGAFRTLAKAPPGRLLDVGCGRGDLGKWFMDKGWEVAGIEPAADAAEQAAECGLQIHVGTLDDAPWPHGTFDAVVFNHALEHVPDPVETLRQSASLLRPGGLVAISVPHFGAWQRRLFGSAWFPLDLPRHLQHFDRVSLTTMATRAGLTPREVRTSSLLAGFPASLQYALRGRLFLSHATMNRLMHLTYPMVLLVDALLREGDCLHFVAERPRLEPSAAT
jgi:SAM-dependent methyltransferase